ADRLQPAGSSWQFARLRLQTCPSESGPRAAGPLRRELPLGNAPSSRSLAQSPAFPESGQEPRPAMAALCGGRQSAPVLFQSQSRARRITMTYSHLGPAMHNRSAWNAGETVGMKRPLIQKQIWSNRFFLDREEQLRDRPLFDLAFDSR